MRGRAREGTLRCHDPMATTRSSTAHAPPAPRERARGCRARRTLPAPAGAAVIEFRGRLQALRRAATPASSRSTFSVDREEFVFLVGSTGSGKSTVMRLLIKELEPTAGTIRVAGRDLHDDPRASGCRSTGATSASCSRTSSCSQPDRVRQRRLRAPGDRRHASRDPREGARHPAPDGTVDQAAQLPRPALRRRAAARVDRARVRQPPAAAARRRADREPRPRDQHRHHAVALPDQPHRHHGARRHPRPGDGRQDAPPRAGAVERTASSATRPPASTRATRRRASSPSGCARPTSAHPGSDRCGSGSSCARRCARCAATPPRASRRWPPCS